MKRMPSGAALLFAGAAWCTLAACGSDPQRTDARPVTDAAVVSDDARAADLGDAADYRGCEEVTSTFALGMEASGASGFIDAKLIAASPSPPARYRNDWTVELVDRHGHALTDATIIKVRPFMPLHGHDGNVQPEVTKGASAGQFKLERLNLLMRGSWEIQLTVSSASAGDDYIVFHVCVAE